MAVLFHPSLGRFVDPDEYVGQGASGTDSDHYYGRGRSAASRPTRREEGHHGQPGSRRHRRFLNSTMSESEYDTDRDFDSDEDRPIVRFEWHGTFTKAGTEFFDHPKPNVDQPDPTRRRRMPKMHRRKRGEVAEGSTTPESTSKAHSGEDDETVVVESKHALARRMRAAKFASVATAGVSPSAASTSAGESDASESGMVGSSSSIAVPSVPSGLQTQSIAEAATHPRREKKIAGQEHAGALLLTVEHSVRRALRKADATQLAFLGELESVLVAYKTGRHLDDATIHQTFDLLPYDVAAHEQQAAHGDHDTEVTSDGEDEFAVVEQKRGRPARTYPLGEEPLTLAFRNAYERFLAHGLVQFHQLVAVSHNHQPTDQRLTEIKIPRHGVLLHSARLVTHLQRSAAKAKRHLA